ncbi:MAG: InlB B-repeat-containing protein, partial [Acholeplasmatales bacterium]|nr:InlB B-repeat-containing protein [Acholeplasmatales bacterium]
MKKKKILASGLLGISVLVAGVTLTSCDMTLTPSYEQSSTTTTAPKPTATTTKKPTTTTTTTTTVQKVTVTFNSNGGTQVVAQSINKGGKVTKPTNPTKASVTEGNKTTTYTFGGWYTDTGLTKAFDFNTVVNANTTLYAKWNATITEELTVTFNTMGGSSIQQQKVIKGNKVARPTTDPTKNATAQFTYSFAGWYKDQAYTTVFDFANEVINANTTIYAKWTEITNKYDVTWKNGDTVLKTEKVAYGKTPVYSGSTPTKAADVQYSYTFIGWTPEVDAVTKAITYTATFKETTNKYKVTWLNYDGSELDFDDVEYDQTPEYFGAEPLKPSDDQYDYTFIAWTPTISKVTGDVTYTATFTETLREYTVTFYNGDDEFDVQTVKYGSKPTTPDVSVNTPTKASTIEKQYTFKGWALSPDGDAITEFDDVTGETEYYAVFDEEDKVYTVKWNNYDGSKFADDSTWTYGQGYPVMPAGIPTKPADDTYRYEFNIWDSTEPTASSNVIVCTPTFTEIKIFDVTYNTMGANETLEAQTVDKDACAIEPAVTLTKFASKFVGWYTSNDNGQTLSQDAYDFATPVTGALTLYAKWEELTKATVATTVNIGESEDYKAPVFDENYYIPQIASKASTDTIYTLIKTDDTVIVHDADTGKTAYTYLTQGINVTTGYLQVTTEFSLAKIGSKWNIVNLVNSSGSTIFSIGLEGSSNKYFSYSLNGSGNYLDTSNASYIDPDTLDNKEKPSANTKYKAVINIDFANNTISYSINGKSIVTNVQIDAQTMQKGIQAIMFQTATSAADRDITITELHSDYANEDLADIKADVIASINAFVEKLELDTYYTKNKAKVLALQTDYISNVNAATSNQEAILNYYYFYSFVLTTVYSDLQEMIINYETIIKDKLSTDYPNKTYEMSKVIEEEIDEYTTKRIYYGLMNELEDAVYSAKDKDEFDSIISLYENQFVAIADDVATIQSQYKTQKVNALKENYPETLYTVNATAYNKVFEDLNTTLATLTVKSDIDGALNAAETILMSIEEDSYGLRKYKELVAYTNTEIDKLLIKQKDKYAGSTYETEINGILSAAEVNIKLDEADYSDDEEYEEAVDEQFGNEKGNIDTKIAAIKAVTEFTVTLKFNNGTDDSVSTVYVGDKIDAPTAPTKTGSTFKGWFTKDGTNDDWGNEWNFTNDTVTATTTLYARFDINQYEVTFDTNGAKETAPAKQTIDYGSKATTPGNEFTKDKVNNEGVITK